MKTEESVRQAIESLRENVKTILESESKDYNSKQLIESIGTKDQQFAEYFKKFVN